MKKKVKIVRKPKDNVVSIKRKRRKKRRGAKIGGLIILLIITVFALMLTPYFHIKWFDITGNEKVTNEQIIQTANLQYNTNLFKVNLKNAESAISKIPYINTVTVRRKLPDGIRVQVTECVPVAYMPFGTAYVMIDENGKLLETVDKLENGPALPVVNGITVDNFQLGMSLSETNPNEAKALKSLLEKLREYELYDRVSAFDISNSDNLSFVFDQHKKVVVGDSYRLDYKLMMLKAAIEQLAPSEAGTIDLTIEGKAVFTPDEDQ